MKIPTFLYISAFLWLVCLRLSAQDQKLIVWHADGSTTSIELSSRPCITFNNNAVQINSAVSKMEMASRDVIRFSYTGMDTTPVKSIQQTTKYTWKDNQLILHGNVCKKISIFRTDGVVEHVNTIHNGDDTIVELNALPSGIYVINMNGIIVKYLKQ